MIIVACTDDPNLVEIAQKSSQKYPAVFGKYYKVFDTVIPQIDRGEDLFVIAHGVYNGDEGRPVIGDRQRDFYLNAEDLYLNLKTHFPQGYKGNIFIDACESADYNNTVSFIEILKTFINDGGLKSRVFGREGCSSGLISLPTDRGWIEAR